MAGATPTYDTGVLITMANSGNTTINSTDQSNYFSRGVIVSNNLTIAAGNLTIKVQGKDTASGTYYDILDSAVISSTAFSTLTIYPGAPVTSNVSVNAPLPATWRVSAVIGSTGNVTGTIGASVIE